MEKQNLSPEMLQMLVAAQAHANAANATLTFVMSQVAALYGLQPGDQIDEKTGAITRPEREKE